MARARPMSAPADVAESREPAVQARAHKLCREVRRVDTRRLHNPHDVQSRRIHMHMGIDKPRHQNPSAAVDDLVTLGRGPLGNLDYAIAFDKNVNVFS